jgi:hypothetical protein
MLCILAPSSDQGFFNGSSEEGSAAENKSEILNKQRKSKSNRELSGIAWIFDHLDLLRASNLEFRICSATVSPLGSATPSQ